MNFPPPHENQQLTICLRIRGKIPWFTPPPYKESESEGPVKEGREGKLGEMSKKRKREIDSEAATGVVTVTDTVSTFKSAGTEDDDDFSGFSDNEALHFDGDENDDEEDVSEDDQESGTLLDASAEIEDTDDDQEVEEAVAAISHALSKAKKRQRTA